jgi:hypothetical protein
MNKNVECGWKIINREEIKVFREKTCPGAILSTKNLIWTAQGSNRTFALERIYCGSYCPNSNPAIKTVRFSLPTPLMHIWGVDYSSTYS